MCQRRSVLINVLRKQNLLCIVDVTKNCKMIKIWDVIYKHFKLVF